MPRDIFEIVSFDIQFLGMKFYSKRIPLVVITAALVVGLDQWTKAWAVESLKGNGRESYLNDFFRLVYAENTGAFLSLGSGLADNWRYWLLTLLPIAVILLILGQTLTSPGMNRWQVVAFSLIIGGGGSNLYDRLLYGKVVDFMNMGFPKLRTGIFNVADVAIMIGLFMLILAMLTNRGD